MSFYDFSFWIISIVVLLSALGVVMLNNIIHSALSLVVTFIGVAGLYLLLEAEFLAAVQILVYGGAISIIIVFAIMLIQREEMHETNLFSKLKIPGALVALGFTGVVAWLIFNTKWAVSQATEGLVDVGSLAELMLGDYVIPFEIAAILLLVAMVGAIVIAREVKKSL